MNDVLALVLTLVLGLFILGGALIVFLVKKSDKLVHFSISVAFGVMISLAIFELFPEAKELITPTRPAPFNYLMILGFALLGIVILKVLDLFIPDHELEDHKKGEKKNLYHVGYVASFAFILHNIIEGIAIYSTATSSSKLGLLVSIGVGLHNIPLGMVVASTLYQTTKDKKKTLIQIGIIAISTFIGGLLMYFMNEHVITNFRLGMLLSITLGMIFYIVVFELLPHIIHEKDKKLSILGILIGVSVLFISQLF